MEELTGLVTSGLLAPGSKSERRGIYLDTAAGRFVLRRPGANAFSDPVLEKLVGRRITAFGEMRDYILLLADWRAVHDD
ncbi:hypothetical protein [Sphingomonas solaris]|uniref:Uncharacterized protein n=1 Tax=Alterirhizorhabdus solaris TaxID=2529389 RepID=A0A558RC16_9SPHN|nr:hypothetical protein [Sphingomonas solaris]TVV76959.1 hypothetical protein FOY91_02650 [Sphingomonas solaris]